MSTFTSNLDFHSEESVPDTPHEVPVSKQNMWRGGLRFGAATRCGPRHSENQDSVRVVSEGMPFLGVVDGVGGGAMGGLASATLLQCLPDLFGLDWRKSEQITQWLREADATVATALAAHTNQRGAATFVAAQAQTGSGAYWRLAWVGDCRAYKWRSATEELTQLTRDHTYAQLGESPPAHAGPDDPARMVGTGAIDKPGLSDTTLVEGEMLLLCSDGLFKALKQESITSILASPATLNDRCQMLIAAAYAAGGQDDATVACVERVAWFAARRWFWGALAISLCAVGALLLLH